MAIYKKILVAVDLHPEHDDKTLARAKEFAQVGNSSISVVHAVEEINAYGATQGYEIVLDVQEKLAREANANLSTLASKYGLTAEQQIIETGPPKHVIINHAKKLNADLIIVGSHGRHGLDFLFGTTADDVTHDAPCDVLVVKVGEASD